MRIDALHDVDVVLRNIHTNEVKQIQQHELFEAIFSGQLQHPEKLTINFEEHANLSDSTISRINARQESNIAVQDMLNKRAWIEALKAKGIKHIVDDLYVRVAIEQLASGKLANFKRYSIDTLAKTASLVSKAQGDWSQVVPRYSERGGTGKSRLDVRAEVVIKTVLDELKENKTKVVKEDIYAEIRTVINTLNLASPNDLITTPGDTTISRRISSLFTQKEIHIRNSSAESAAHEFRQNSYPRDVAEYPLLISEYDDLDSGVFLIDDSNGLPFGRGYITHGICQNTLVPLGFDLSHESRSYDSAMGAISDSFLPKDTSRAEFEGCKHSWVGYGVQGSILMDNAKYNFSDSMNKSAIERALALCAVRPYGPTEKACIEHFNRATKDGYCSTLPGWRGDKCDADGVKNGMRGAILTVKAFRKGYVHWLTGNYLNKPGEDGWTPKQRWQKYYATHGPSIRWTREEIAFLRLRPTMLTFRDSGGLQRLKLTYNSNQLITWTNELGKDSQILVFTDRKDLTYIFAKHPRTREIIRIPCTSDFKYVNGLTEHQQQLVLKTARERGIKNPSLLDMVESRQSLRKLVEQETQSVKMRRRSWAQRVGTIPEQDLYSEESKRAPNQTEPFKTKIVDKVITNLEWHMVQLESIDLETEIMDWSDQ